MTNSNLLLFNKYFLSSTNVKIHYKIMFTTHKASFFFECTIIRMEKTSSVQSKSPHYSAFSLFFARHQRAFHIIFKITGSENDILPIRILQKRYLFKVL